VVAPAFRTTAGAIAVADLDSQIDTEQRLFAQTQDLALGVQLIDLLSERAQFLGTLEDLDASDDLSLELVRRHPADPSSLLARASVLNGLHRFQEALSELDAAATRGGSPDRIALQRASTLLAMGRATEAAQVFARVNRQYPTLHTLGDEAMARAELGDAQAARNLFRQALSSYRDVSPFPVAWVDFHAAMVEDKLGHAMRHPLRRAAA